MRALFWGLADAFRDRSSFAAEHFAVFNGMLPDEQPLNHEVSGDVTVFFGWFMYSIYALCVCVYMIQGLVPHPPHAMVMVPSSPQGRRPPPMRSPTRDPRGLRYPGASSGP